MRLTKYDIWKILAGGVLAMWFYSENWVWPSVATIVTGFIYGWSTVYRPKGKSEPYKLPEEKS